MQTFTFVLAWTALFVLAVTQASAAGDARLSGDWVRADGASRINIAPCGERLCATNIWVKDPGKGERVGDRIVMSVTPRQRTILAGEAFDVRRGLTYSVQISLDRNAMTTKGCLVAGLVCRTIHWVRTP